MQDAPYAIRVFGDPVLKTRCGDIGDIDGTIRTLVRDMIRTMYAAPGVGLAAPQVGVQKRVFVYDDGDGSGARTMINPVIIESDGEFEYEEGCLSVPGLYFPIVRHNRVHVKAVDLDGNDIDMEAEGFLGRILQHEVDHLEGVLLLKHLTQEQRKKAMPRLRDMTMKTG